MLSERESKVVFKDGNQNRVLRGIITTEDDFFITLERRDGTVRIAKSSIIKIDERIVQYDNGFLIVERSRDHV